MDIEKAFSRYMQYTIKSTIGLGAQGKYLILIFKGLNLQLMDKDYMH